MSAFAAANGRQGACISDRLSGSAVNMKVARFEPIADAAEFAVVLIVIVRAFQFVEDSHC